MNPPDLAMEDGAEALTQAEIRAGERDYDPARGGGRASGAVGPSAFGSVGLCQAAGLAQEEA
jgi:hypothetical protein